MFSQPASSGAVLKSSVAPSRAISSMLHIAAILPAQSGCACVMKLQAPMLQSYQALV